MFKHPALERYECILTHFDPVAVVRFAVRDGYVAEAIAPQAMEGLLQWLAGHAVERHDQPYVMMNGVVDEMYHAFMLNSRRYLHFCRDHVGFYIHHTPLDDAGYDAKSIGIGIDYTLAYLRKAFGDSLSPTLKEWIAMRDRGELNATSVSCVGNGFDAAPSRLLGITDFATFWDQQAPVAGSA